MSTTVDPLNWNVPIVDSAGRPTAEFMRKWLQQQKANSAIPSTFVESVQLSSPAFLPASGGGSGAVDLQLELAAQTANDFFAAPNGASGAPAFRPIAPADLPIATTGSLGIVEPDGTTITISGGGVISATGGGGGGTNIDLYGPPTASSFTTFSGDATTPVLANAANLGMTVDFGASVGSNLLRGATIPAPGATPWTFTVRLRATFVPWQYRGVGICLSDGTKYIYFGWLASNPPYVVVQWYANANGSGESTQLAQQGAQQYEYLQIYNDGTNLHFGISTDGRQFSMVHSEANNAFLAISETGVCCNANNSGGPSGDVIYGTYPYYLAA